MLIKQILFSSKNGNSIELIIQCKRYYSNKVRPKSAKYKHYNERRVKESQNDIKLLDQLLANKCKQQIRAKIYTNAIKGCISTQNDSKAMEIYNSHILRDERMEIQSDIILNTCLITMLSHFGHLNNLQSIWNKIKQSSECDVISWNAMMHALIINNECNECLQLFNELMNDSNLSPNTTSFIIALKACTRMKSLKNGKEIHHYLESFNDIFQSVQIQNSLMTMYSNCNETKCAKKIFKNMKHRNIHDTISYGIMMNICLNLSENEKVIQIFDEMMRKGKNKPNNVIFLNVIKAISNLRDVKKGNEIYKMVECEQKYFDISVKNALIAMYGKFDDMANAERTFEKFDVVDIVSLNCMMSVYIDNESSQNALDLFVKYDQNNLMKFNEVTYINALKACIKLKSLSDGQWIHSKIVQSHDQNEKIMSLLIDFYAKCNQIDASLKVFHSLSENKDVNVINSMMNVLINNNQSEKALHLFDNCTKKDIVSYNIALKACVDLMSLERGKQIHALMINTNNEILSNFDVQINLINMYGKCGDIASAQTMWNKLEKDNNSNIILYNVMMNIYAQHNEFDKLFAAYQKIKGIDEQIMNEKTFSTVLKACLNGTNVDVSYDLIRDVHMHIICSPNVCVYDNIQLKSLLIKVYAKYGHIEQAKNVWNANSDLQTSGIIYWNSFFVDCIQCYVDEEDGDFIFDLLKKMMNEYELKPNLATFLIFCKFCADKLLLKQGRLIHEMMHFLDIDEDEKDFINAYNALINMYGKCGDLKSAQSVWNEIEDKYAQYINMSSWNSMINAFGINNDGQSALRLFKQMKHRGFEPDTITYTSILNACSHSLLFDEAQQIIDDMTVNAVGHTEAIKIKQLTQS